MNFETKLNLGGVPERMKEEGVFLHYQDLGKVGDEVVAVTNVDGKLEKGMQFTIQEIIIEPYGDKRGFYKRIKLKDMQGDFNPKRFKLVKKYERTK